MLEKALFFPFFFLFSFFNVDYLWAINPEEYLYLYSSSPKILVLYVLYVSTSKWTLSPNTALISGFFKQSSSGKGEGVSAQMWEQRIAAMSSRSHAQKHESMAIAQQEYKCVCMEFLCVLSEHSW